MTRGVALWLAIRERASRCSLVLPMPGAPVNVTTMGVLSSAHRSNALTICASSASRPTKGRAADDLAPATKRLTDHRAAVIAQLKLEAPSSELRRRRVGQHLRGRRVAGEGGRAIDHLARRTRLVDPGASGGDAHRCVELRDAKAKVEGPGRLVSECLADPEVAHDGVPSKLRCVGSASTKVHEQTRPRGALGNLDGDDGRHQARAAALVRRRAEAHGYGVEDPAALQVGLRVGSETDGDVPERLRHGRSRHRALFRRRRKQVSEGLIQRWRRVLEHLRQTRRRRRHEPREDRDGGRPHVWRSSGDHLEECGPEAVEVGAAIDVRVAAGLFGCHVRGRAHDRAGAGQFCVLGCGDAEVDELDVEGAALFGPAALEDDVRGLDVSVHDAGRMGSGQRLRYVGCNKNAFGEPQRGAPLALGNVLALEPLHRDVGVALLELAERHHPHDAGVAQCCEQSSLATEARFFARIDARQGDHLQRDGKIAQLVARAVDDAHAAAADLPLDDEASSERLGGRIDHARFPEPTTKISVLPARVPSGRMRRSPS